MTKKQEELTEQEEAEFQNLLKFVLRSEGGYSNNKNDRGGETNLGITQATYEKYQNKQCAINKLPKPQTYKSVKSLTKEGAIKIYRSEFYMQYNCHKIKDLNTRYLYFDMVVNQGTKSSAEIIQKSVNLEVDYKVGKLTLDAINSGNQEQIQKNILQLRREHYVKEAKKPGQAVFEKGWLNRMNDVQKRIDTRQIQSDQSRPSTQASFNSGSEKQQIGGIDLSINIDAFKNIKGINKFSTKFINDNQENIQLSDLATVLRVYTDPNIPQQHKHICFSLDPVFVQNEAKFKEQEKVVWPDKFLNKNIIMDTEFVKVLFESDFLMKLMSLGVNQDGITPFQFPLELKNRGLKPTMQFQGKNSSDKQQLLCRFWLVPGSCTYSYQNEKYIIEDVKVVCESRQIETINNQLVDKINQDPSDCNYQFAQKFTELYDLISQFYPVFQRLKQVFKAVALGRWMCENRIQVDLQLLERYMRQKSNSPYVIPIISYEKSEGKLETPIFHTQQEKIQIAKEFLLKNGHQTSQTNIDQILKQIPDQKGVKVQERTFIAMGGIDPNCKKMIEKQPQANQKPKTYEEIINQQNDDQLDIPFIKTIKCQNCSRNVENTLVMLDQTKCSIHNDYTCYMCLQLITKECQKPIGLTINGKQYGFHAECFDEYSRETDDEEF